MRVAILSGNARPTDAIGNQIAEKAAFFLERGADVRVFVEDARTLHPAIASHSQAVETDPLSTQTREFLAASDLVIAEFGHYHSLLELLPLCSRLGRRVLVDYHGITPLELWGDQNREPIAIALRRRGIVWYADAVLVHSGFTENEILADTDFPRERTFVLGHPIDVERFRSDGSLGPWRRRLGLVKNDRLLLFVGRIARSKRIDILIEALSRLPTHVALAIAGDSEDIYALEAQRCRKLAMARGLAGRIHWLGQVADAHLPALYRAADAFVTASEHEGFCIPVAEALCSGTPVVASRASALPETVGAGGLLFTPGDTADLAQQLQRLLFDEPSQIAVLRERGLAQASRFARPRWREGFGRLVEQIRDMPSRPMVERLQLEAASEIETVSAGQKQALVALRVTNDGSHPVDLGEIRATPKPGTGAWWYTFWESHAKAQTPENSHPRVAPANNGSNLIMPGRSATILVLVEVPAQAGMYTIRVQIEKESALRGTESEGVAECRIKLDVTESANPLRSTVVELAQLCRLPEGYEYPVNGRLGRIKAWLKEKVLGGLRRRYVDVLSRQQSTVNGLILAAIAGMTAKVERLQRTRGIDDGASQLSLELLDRVRKLECRVAELEETQQRQERPCHS
jgi:glycosyltransferase involved in cell wall biosynthesis